MHFSSFAKLMIFHDFSKDSNIYQLTNLLIEFPIQIIFPILMRNTFSQYKILYHYHQNRCSLKQKVHPLFFLIKNYHYQDHIQISFVILVSSIGLHLFYCHLFSNAPFPTKHWEDEILTLLFQIQVLFHEVIMEAKQFEYNKKWALRKKNDSFYSMKINDLLHLTSMLNLTDPCLKLKGFYA